MLNGFLSKSRCTGLHSASLVWDRSAQMDGVVHPLPRSHSRSLNDAQSFDSADRINTETDIDDIISQSSEDCISLDILSERHQPPAAVAQRISAIHHRVISQPITTRRPSVGGDSMMMMTGCVGGAMFDTDTELDTVGGVLSVTDIQSPYVDDVSSGKRDDTSSTAAETAAENDVYITTGGRAMSVTDSGPSDVVITTEGGATSVMDSRPSDVHIIVDGGEGGATPMTEDGEGGATLLTDSRYSPETHGSVASRQRCRQRIFVQFFQEFVHIAPNILSLQLPFDWSARSVRSLTSLTHLHTLKLFKYFPYQTFDQGLLAKALSHLPQLKDLTLEVWSASGAGLIPYALRSESLERVDVSACRGFSLTDVSLPRLRSLSVARCPRYGPLASGTLTDHVPCLHGVLSTGASHLQWLNGHRLSADWHYHTDSHLERVLQESCACQRHYDVTAAAAAHS